MAVHVVIPARFASSRLPGKPLCDIAGKTMIQRVHAIALSCYDSVVVATDHIEIYDAVKAFGGNAVMTGGEHDSGTDRLAEVADRFEWPNGDIVINLQGDEPLLPSVLLNKLVEALEQDKRADIATLVTPIQTMEEYTSEHSVKAVFDEDGYALYFSRAQIPYCRDGLMALEPNLSKIAHRHIGLYAYRVASLRNFSAMGSGSPNSLENIEKLEQLRALTHKMKIKCVLVDKAPPAGVDTEEDLDRVCKVFKDQA
ncbi:3-deoxy-manno-octulosonate cytidylyltransferase [Vibrio mediterranei]|uniref:3-deoxy-manno-octulosonate cytidylyltransferase n=1 Tax=Vibrio mediterranei TaxID=689 RepID=UPI004067D461